MNHILDANIIKIAEALRSGKTSCENLIDEAIHRHASFGAALAAYKFWDANSARQSAKAIDQLMLSGYDTGALMGIPVSVKDLYGVRGMPTFAGTPSDLPVCWRTEGPVVKALRESHSIILGKTHTVEFAYGGVGTNEHWGTPVNPWDENNHRVTGGSSSGAGVSLCQGSALVAMGTDTGGSVRIPASVTGNVGLKVSIDRWSVKGIVPLSHSFDTPGPLTRNVTDAIVAFNAIDPAGKEIHATLECFEQSKLSDFNFAICDDHFWDRCGPDIATAINDAIAELSAAGARIRRISFPEATMARESALMGGIFGVEGQAYIEEYYPDRLNTLDANVADRLADSQDTSAIQYLKAIRRLSKLGDIANEKFSYIDAIITPTLPIAPPIVSEVADKNTYKSYLGHMTQNTHPANLLKLCAITLPVALDRLGLPVGLQLISGRGKEEKLLAMALSCEKVFGTALERLGYPPRCKNE